MLGHPKANYSLKGRPLRYAIRPKGDDPSVAEFMWRGPSHFDIDELSSMGKTGKRRLADAIRVVKDVLASGPTKGSKVHGAIRAAVLTKADMENAITALGVRRVKRPGPGGIGDQWVLSLPAHIDESDFEEDSSEPPI